MTPWYSGVRAFAAATVLASCAGEGETEKLLLACSDPRSAPVLIQVDSLVLQESEAFHVGNPSARFFTDGVGRIYVPDAANNRLLRFRNDGSADLQIGRSGSGPGEFRGISYLGLAAKGLIVQDDYRLRALQVFQQESGEFIGTITSDIRAGLAPQESGGVLWLAGFDGATEHAVGSLPIERLLQALSDSSRATYAPTIVSVPEIYNTHRMVRDLLEMVHIAVWHDSLVAGFGGQNALVRHSLDGTPLDTVSVPACRRRGLPHQVLEDWYRERPGTSAQQEAFARHGETAVSGLLGIWRVPEIGFVLWHQDNRFAESRAVIVGTAFISVVSADLKRVCVDAPVRAPGSNRPRLAMEGDRLLVLDQVLGRDDRSVTTVIRRYRIDTSWCRWIPAAPGDVAQLYSTE